MRISSCWLSLSNVLALILTAMLLLLVYQGDTSETSIMEYLLGHVGSVAVRVVVIHLSSNSPSFSQCFPGSSLELEWVLGPRDKGEDKRSCENSSCGLSSNLSALQHSLLVWPQFVFSPPSSCPPICVSKFQRPSEGQCAVKQGHCLLEGREKPLPFPSKWHLYNIIL